MNKKNLLDDEINRLYDKLKTLEPDAEEYAAVEESWIKLVNQKLEIEKHEADKKDRGWRYGIDIGKTVFPLVLSGVGIVLAFTFEEKGTISSKIGQKLYDKITKY